jgi:hypothetical protein
LRFNSKINPQKISQGLLTGLLLANCTFCRWGVILNVKQVSSQTAIIDLSPFKNDIIYATQCAKEVSELLPSCYETKFIDNKFFIIRFRDELKDNLRTVGESYE